MRAVYFYSLYINKHTCMYIFQKNMPCLYIKYIYLEYKLYEYKYIHVNTCTYFQNIYCFYMYIINKRRTHIYYANKTLILYAINHG